MKCAVSNKDVAINTVSTISQTVTLQVKTKTALNKLHISCLPVNILKFRIFEMSSRIFSI